MIGKTISHYKIIEKIGGGGMGVVYKAQDLKLDRFVALKFLPPHLTTSNEEKQRFIHEAKAASSLDHNNICAIYEIDETKPAPGEPGDGQLFISMAYYKGETLELKIENGILKIEEAIVYTIQIAQGLQKAHEKEIVHRDIKPANIMLTDDGVVKILDFGLAKLSTQTKLTKESTTLGTVSYMSPEQAKGEDVDYRSDIWSLGVIIYEMLTGQLPFKGEYESAVIYSIMNDTQAPVTALRSGVPMELERIINKCLQKSSADRYQHIDELIVDLQGIKKQSESTGIPSKKEKRKKRSKSILIPIAIISIIILIIAGYFLLQPGEKHASEWENSIAVLPFDNISNDPEQEYFCDGMTEQIISNLSRLARLKVLSRTSVMNFKDTQKSIPEIGKELNVAYVLEGSIRKFGNRIRVTAQLINTGDDFHLWSQDYDKEYQSLFDVQDEVSEAIAISLLNKISGGESLAIKSNRPINLEAYEYYLKARHLHYIESTKGNIEEDSVEKCLIKSEEIFKKSIALDPNFADSYAALADVYNSKYYFFSDTDEERDKYWQLSETYLDTALTINPKSAEAFYVKHYLYGVKAEKFLKSQDYSKYEYELGESYRCLITAIKYDNNHKDALQTLGSLYSSSGLNNLAIKCFNRGLELDPLDYVTYAIRGKSYLAIGEYEKAERDFKKVLENYPRSRNTPYRYAELLIAQKRFKEAEKMLGNIKKLHPDANTDVEYALIYASRGQKEQALKIYKDENPGIYALLNMKEEAISIGTKYSNEQLLEKNSWYNYLETNPFFDNLRSDPRFQEIVAKHKELYEENLAKYGDLDI
jgi:serine/threonine protein kinase/Flp pilus assembly protein TadD